MGYAEKLLIDLSSVVLDKNVYISIMKMLCLFVFALSQHLADLEGGATSAHPPKKKLDRLCFIFIPFCIRMLKNKAQIVRESIKNPRASRALKRALDPGGHDVCTCT